MNTIDLLDKLNLPSRLGLKGDEALFSQQTIMDAYLSAASLQFNRQLFGMDSLYSGMPNDRSADSFLSLNQVSADLCKPTGTFDLFKKYGSEVPSFEDSETKIAIDLMKLKEYVLPSQEVSNTQSETELESYTKLESAHIEETTKEKKKGKGKKTDKSDVNAFVSEERRRLLKKLESCSSDRTIFKRRVKNSKKDPKISADNYRGSRFWGVSKNKSKWQVSLLFIFTLTERFRS